MWPLVRYIFVMLVCLIHIFLRSMLALLALCHLLGFHCFFASLHACLHVHAWVCVLSILQSHGDMDTRSKPTFVPFLFDNMFVCPRLALYLVVFLLAYFSPSYFFASLLACFLCHCMYMLGVWTLGVRVQPPRHKWKKARMQARRCKPTRGNI